MINKIKNTDIKIGETYPTPGSIVDDAAKCGTGKVNNFPEGITECNFSKRARYGHVVRVPIVDSPTPGPGQDPDNEVSDSSEIGQASNPAQEIIEEDTEAVSEVKSGVGSKKIITEGDCSKTKDKSEPKIGDCEHCDTEYINIEKEHLKPIKQISCNGKEKSHLYKILEKTQEKIEGKVDKSSKYTVKRWEHLESAEIKCKINPETGERIYEVKGCHWLSEKLKSYPDLKIVKVRDCDSGCWQAEVSYKGSNPKMKGMFPTKSTSEQRIEWIIESINNPIDIDPATKESRGKEIITGKARINGVNVTILSVLIKSKNGITIESSYPILENK